MVKNLPIAPIAELSYNHLMMRRIFVLLVIVGFSGSLSPVRAEQMDLAKHCEHSCECVPCGCASIRCSQHDKNPFSSQSSDSLFAPVGDAVIAK